MIHTQVPIAALGRITGNLVKAISTMAGMQRVGNFIGPATAGVVAHLYGFDVVFLGVGFIALAGVAVTYP